jgi:transcriptional regulator with XRE-family HTH domain
MSWQPRAVSGFDVAAALRRIRRLADASQRELAEWIGISKSALAAAESGSRGLDVRVLACAAEVAGLSLALLDRNGDRVEGMTPDGVRDRFGRRFPAHLDTRYGDEGWWHGPERGPSPGTPSTGTGGAATPDGTPAARRPTINCLRPGTRRPIGRPPGVRLPDVELTRSSSGGASPASYRRWSHSSAPAHGGAPSSMTARDRPFTSTAVRVAATSADPLLP